jgi:hypothetical protein
MNKNTKIKVTNRSSCSLGYTIPDMNNYRRRFAAGESKELPFEEVQKLTYLPGGDYMLQHYLVIDNIEARDEILGAVELEYDYDAKKVKNLLENGSLDELLDCLDFAPLGVIDLVKKIATEIKIYDTRKRKAIFDKTGYNIDTAIMINEETDESVEEKKPSARRVSETTESKPEVSQTPTRRVGAYAVTKK